MSALQHKASAEPAIFHNNPVLVQLLGLSPFLALTTSLTNGIALGLVTMLVLLAASITVSLSRHLIRHDWRFAYFLFVLAVFTTAADILMQRFHYALYRDLGIYVPLICCNLALVLHLEFKTGSAKIMRTLTDSLIAGCGILLAFVVFSACRELLIHGRIEISLQSLTPALAPTQGIDTPRANPDWFQFARLAPGALLLLGLLLALKNWLTPYTTKPTANDDVTPVQRARVTGKIQAS